MGVSGQRHEEAQEHMHRNSRVAMQPVKGHERGHGTPLFPLADDGGRDTHARSQVGLRHLVTDAPPPQWVRNTDVMYIWHDSTVVLPFPLINSCATHVG